jgi:oxygen-dependent protoporphyrinogen oxidase
VKLLVDAARSSRKLSFEDLSLAASLDTESAGDYARRRLNTELLERLVDPTVRGLAGTTADDISNVDFFFALLKFLGSKFVAFRDGMCSYSTELSARFDVELNALVSHVEEIEDHVEVHWSDANGVERHSEAAGCVLAVPASQVPSLYPQMDLWRSEFLDGVRYTKLVGVHVALSKPPKNVPAACVLLPKAVHPGLIAMVLEHLKAPGRAPAGKGLVGFFTDNGWAEELMDSDDDVVIKELVSGGERFLPGVSNDIEFAVVSRWNEVVLHARPGHYGGLRTFVELSKSKDKLIQLGGDFFSSANVNTATAGGERAARDLLAVLRIRSG